MSRPRSDGEAERLAKALDHPVRRGVLLEMARDPQQTMSPVQWFREHDERSTRAALANIAHHFRVLSRLDLIRLVSTRTVRGGTEHRYKLAAGVRDHPLIRQSKEGDTK